MQVPLHDNHLSLGAKMMDFGGWSVPLSYSSTISEHHQVRNACGLFDVSHMGEISVSGPDALPLLQYLTCNDVSRLTTCSGQYTALLNEKGGFIDDLILYRLEEESFMLCVNAANAEKCFTHVTKHSEGKEVKIENLSNHYCQFALQGPHSEACLTAMLEKKQLQFPQLKYMEVATLCSADQLFHVARTGYTGEKGFEIYVPLPLATQMWQDILATGHDVKPIGFGARDTLRLEACYLLYGNDMDDTVSPYEAGISWAVKLTKDFLGKKALLESRERGIQRKIVAFKMLERGFPRQGMTVLATTDTEKTVGKVTSGSVLPTVGGFGGLALLHDTSYKVGNEFFISNRGKLQKARIEKKPLYQAKCKE